MTFIANQSASHKKNDILRTTYNHIQPGRVAKFMEGGLSFVPDKREGYRMWDVDGHEVLDLHLNGGTYNLGHRHPKLVATLKTALETLDVGNHHFPSEHRAELAKALIKNTPGDMQYVVFTPSGGEANDVAIKSARFATGRRKIVSLAAGFHGRSGLSGAAGNSDDAEFFKSDYPNEFIRVPFNDLKAMEKALSGKDVALVMMETIPATFGFPIPHDDYLPGVKALCEKYGSLMLADEVQTGLGRTGYRWGIEAYGVEPDMLVTGKGLSGGLYPIAALVMNEKPGSWLVEKGWGHVSTFGGSDLGCKVALEVLNISLSETSLNNARVQAKYLRDGLEKIKPRFPFFTNIRQKGLVMGLEFESSTMAWGMMRALYENGIWAIVAGYDETVVQFKPGLLVDKAFCDETLKRFENACIWLVNNITNLIMGENSEEQLNELIGITELAKKAIQEWGLSKVEIKLLKHRENSVFKITDESGKRYALRIHRKGYHSNEALASEIKWMSAIQESGLSTPTAVSTTNNDLFAVVTHKDVLGTRQCSLVEWIEGSEFHDLGRVEKGVKQEMVERYEQLGAMAAKLHNQSEQWQPPANFTRHAWDNEGLLGENPLWGRFWEHPLLTKKQQDSFLKARLVLQLMLKDLGKNKSNYGLIHADFLPENILVNKGELKLIDFDDCGYGWHLFEMATSLFPQADQPFYDDLVAAYVKGYRQHRAFSDEQLALLPAFIMIRAFVYIGWLKTRSDSMANGDKLALKLAETLEGFIPELLKELSPVQRLAVETLHLAKKVKGYVKPENKPVSKPASTTLETQVG